MGSEDPRETVQKLGYSDLSSPARRSFLDYLLGTSALATLGAIVYPIFKFMSPPQLIESAENSVVAAKLNEVPINSQFRWFSFCSWPCWSILK